MEPLAPRSIQTTLSRWLAMQSLVGLSIACVLIYAATRWSFHVKQEEEFDRYRELVRHAVEDSGSPRDLDALKHKLGDFFAPHLDVAIEVSAGTERLYRSERRPGPAHAREQTTQFGNLLTFGNEPVSLTIILGVRGDEKLLNRLAWTLLAAVVLGSALVGASGAILVRRGLRPLKTLAAQTAAVSLRKPGLRLKATGYAAEIQPWVMQFNSLLDRVEEAYGQLEAFNADVAHELRTPLANMIAHLDVELGQRRSLDELQDALASQLEEARRLSGIVTDMLFLSRVDRGLQARRAAAVELAQEALKVIEFHEPEIEQAGLSCQVVGSTRFALDHGLIRRALSNLVSNAVRYATTGSEIRVEISRQGATVTVAVVNQGQAIDAAALPRLFERFYRADPSRSGSATHHGLGLAIVAAIARMHGGATFAESENGETRIGLLMADPL
ncbi:MAG: two-component sensor histidine kinase [Variovorax paradoxus]|uniref:Sensor protein n=1 Tax=Variovorax paradoxus TaxID=34073 RepID=A0A2W5QET0_VARPD|nr:MAG: two-component sensor histidine kinase [Variovorax paradoxus]